MTQNGIHCDNQSVLDKPSLLSVAQQYKALYILDVREREKYEAMHLKGACNIPLAELPERIYELPSRQHPLTLIASSHQISTAIKILKDSRYKVAYAFAPLKQDWERLNFSNLTEKGFLNYRLWSPNFLLSESLEIIEDCTQGRDALDIACGSGRDAIFLASQGWNVTACDYQQTLIEKVNQLAYRENLSIKTKCIDFESTVIEHWQPQADLIIVMRYLHRPLFEKIDTWLNPGGILVYQTFHEGAAKFGKPKNPRFLLKTGELKSFFSTYEVLRDSIDMLDDGRPVSSFVAKKQ